MNLSLFVPALLIVLNIPGLSLLIGLPPIVIFVASFLFFNLLPGWLFLKLLKPGEKYENSYAISFAMSLGSLSVISICAYVTHMSINSFIWLVVAYCFVLFLFYAYNLQAVGWPATREGFFDFKTEDPYYFKSALLLQIGFALILLWVSRYAIFGMDTYSHIARVKDILDSDTLPTSGIIMHNVLFDPVYSANQIYLSWASICKSSGLQPFKVYVYLPVLLSFLSFSAMRFFISSAGLARHEGKTMLALFFWEYGLKSIEYNYSPLVHLAQPASQFIWILVPLITGLFLEVLSGKGKSFKEAVLLGLALGSSASVHLQFTIYYSIVMAFLLLVLYFFKKDNRQSFSKIFASSVLFGFLTLPYFFLKISQMDGYAKEKDLYSAFKARFSMFPLGDWTFFKPEIYITPTNISVIIALIYFSIHILSRDKKKEIVVFSVILLAPFLLTVPAFSGHYLSMKTSLLLVGRFATLDNFTFILPVVAATFLINRVDIYYRYKKIILTFFFLACFVVVWIVISLIILVFSKDVDRFNMFKVSELKVLKKLDSYSGNAKSFISNPMYGDVFSAYVSIPPMVGRFWLAPDGYERHQDFQRFFNHREVDSARNRIIEDRSVALVLIDRQSYAESIAEKLIFSKQDRYEEVLHDDGGRFGLYEVQTGTDDSSYKLNLESYEEYENEFGGNINKIAIKTLYDLPFEFSHQNLLDDNQETFLTWMHGQDVLFDITLNADVGSDSRSFEIDFSRKHRYYSSIRCKAIDANGKTYELNSDYHGSFGQMTVKFEIPDGIDVRKLSFQIKGDKMLMISISEIRVR